MCVCVCDGAWMYTGVWMYGQVHGCVCRCIDVYVCVCAEACAHACVCVKVHGLCMPVCEGGWMYAGGWMCG